MRLTKRVIDEKGIEHIFTKYVKDNQKLKDEKLCQLEDIEDELGIEYLLLDKLRHSKEVYIKNDSGEIVVGYIDSINIRKYMFSGRYKGVSDIKKGFRINFRDYGKKIALTKEELDK